MPEYNNEYWQKYQIVFREDQKINKPVYNYV